MISISGYQYEKINYICSKIDNHPFLVNNMQHNSQTTSNVLMVRPANFSYNIQTAGDNAFQHKNNELSAEDIQKLALIEFNNTVEELRALGIGVLVCDDTDAPKKPDAIFPNNWISTHSDGSIITYPMYAENRRLERRDEIIERIAGDFKVKRRYSFEQYEEEILFLEGTGSMVLDREMKIAYASLSERTSIEVLEKFCVLKEYEKVVFQAEDKNGIPIYHTNVLMAIGRDFAVICAECIRDDAMRNKVLKQLEANGKTVLEINEEDMNAFAGNMLQVENKEGKPILLMSSTARRALTESQFEFLSSRTEIASVTIDTIEKYGGGGIRCMIAEIFLDEQGK